MMSRVPDIDSKFTLHKRQAAKTIDVHPRASGDQKVFPGERHGGRHVNQSPPAHSEGTRDTAALTEFGIRMNESPQKWYALFLTSSGVNVVAYQLLRNC